ncbi:hypothetical protein [Paenibacillus dendritiformis]|uniref:hypothetical protein n=1 Tax=Paenibacillus dendritiformis TaxID=130049 RepID=UPI001300C4AA|nr:hypothetical protein [Paenibacillus dendritiformis]CAH8770376.1 hypothetical protein H7S4_003111 [Paenibacillus dendritiformis]
MANPVNFNDPFDCGISFQSEPLQEVVLKDKVEELLVKIGLQVDEQDINGLKESKKFIEDYFMAVYCKIR